MRLVKSSASGRGTKAGTVARGDTAAKRSTQKPSQKKARAERNQGLGYSADDALELYSALLKPRVIEEQMLLSLRKGLISKWFSGIGQEAISVAAALALDPEEWVLTLHRNLGVFTARGVPVDRLVAQFQGAQDGFTKGRDRSFHFGTFDYRIAGMISHLGPQMAVANGIALAEVLDETGRAALVFCGDGATSQGDFHESLNVAAVWRLPVLFIIENNGYGLSTPLKEQYACKRLSDRAVGYGMKGKTVDGNDFFTLKGEMEKCLLRVREKREPYLLECLTFRMRGHEEASGVKYVPPELFEQWATKDPILRAETQLQASFPDIERRIADIRADCERSIGEEIAKGFASPAVHFDLAVEIGDVFARAPSLRTERATETRELRMVDALADAHRVALETHDNLILMGQDIAEYGGVFKVTEGLVQDFGPDRVRNTPLCESAILGAAFGLSLCGKKSIVEMQFADFVSSGFTQVVNNLAKSNYRWGAHSDVVVRLPCGGGVGAGPFHSQTPEAWFTHTPGLKVVYPSNPVDAKGLLLRSIADPNPVIFMEHKLLYRSTKGLVPLGYYEEELGRANCVRYGSEFAIITYGAGVLWAMNFADKYPQYDPMILDLRSLVPLDEDAIMEAAEECGRVLVIHEAHITSGFGAELAAWIGEHCFSSLDAPVIRVGGLDTPIPFASELEKNFMPIARLGPAVERLLAY